MRVASAAQIVARRQRVAARQARLLRPAHTADPAIPDTLPGYFVDRYAFAAAAPRALLVRPPALSLSRPLVGDRNHWLLSLSRPSRRLSGWRPDPAEVAASGELYPKLRAAWAAFGNRLGLPTGVRQLPDATRLTWRQVMDDSVFYPGPPVFCDARYVDALDDRSFSEIIAEYGPEAPTDFLCLMLQVHETIHRHQTGEPLFNELVQAALWCRFLSDEHLWAFQQDRDDGRRLVREAEAVARLPFLAEAASATRLDTAALTDAIGADRRTYFVACLVASRFDLGIYRYAHYLSHVASLLNDRADAAAVDRHLHRHLL